MIRYGRKPQEIADVVGVYCTSFEVITGSALPGFKETLALRHFVGVTTKRTPPLPWCGVILINLISDDYGRILGNLRNWKD